MVTDDLPTHDSWGTDLARVRAMLDRGFGVQLIAECLGISRSRAYDAVVVATGDREGAPSPEEIAAACEAIQRSWPRATLLAAARGERRISSDATRRATNCVPRREIQSRAQAALNRRVAKRVASGAVNVRQINTADGIKWLVRESVCGAETSRTFATRCEAVRYGQQWLQERFQRQAEACRHLSVTRTEETSNAK